MQPFFRLIVVLGAICLLPAAGYAGDVAIRSPRSGDTIHNNSGNLTVSLRASLGPGELIRLLVDGALTGVQGRGTTVSLEGIDRGEHSLEAQVVDERGTVLARSDTVTFYMWRASSAFPGRKAPSAPKK